MDIHYDPAPNRLFVPMDLCYALWDQFNGDWRCYLCMGYPRVPNNAAVLKRCVNHPCWLELRDLVELRGFLEPKFKEIERRMDEWEKQAAKFGVWTVKRERSAPYTTSP